LSIFLVVICKFNIYGVVNGEILILKEVFEGDLDAFDEGD
jgi:hypothetical protein